MLYTKGLRAILLNQILEGGVAWKRKNVLKRVTREGL